MARVSDKLKNFEENYKKLEELVTALEQPDLTLKESLDLFEQAMRVSTACEGALEYARQRAQALAEAHSPEKEDDTKEEGTLDL